MSDCIFCKIITGEIPARKVHEDDVCIAFLDIQPINIGHTLVVPKEHYTDVTQTPDDLVAHMFTEVKRIGKAAMEAVGADGFNIGVNTGAAAGQVIFHTHLHIMPRFEGDGHTHWNKADVTEEQMDKAENGIKSALTDGS